MYSLLVPKDPSWEVEGHGVGNGAIQGSVRQATRVGSIAHLWRDVGETMGLLGFEEGAPTGAVSNRPEYEHHVGQSLVSGSVLYGGFDRFGADGHPGLYRTPRAL